MKPILKITTFSVLATFALTAKALPPAKFYTSVGIGYDSPSASIASYDPAKEFFEDSLQYNKKVSGGTPEQKQQLIDLYATAFKNTTSIDKSHLAYELSSGVKFAMPNQRFSWGGELGLVGLPKVQASINATTLVRESFELDSLGPADRGNIGYTQSMTNRFGLNLLATGFYHFKQRFNADFKLGVSYMTNKYEFTSNPATAVTKFYNDMGKSSYVNYNELFAAQTKTIKKVIPVAEVGLSYQLPKHIQIGFNVSHYFGKSVEFKNVRDSRLSYMISAMGLAGGGGSTEERAAAIKQAINDQVKKEQEDRVPNDVLADTVMMASVSYDF